MRRHTPSTATAALTAVTIAMLVGCGGDESTHATPIDLDAGASVSLVELPEETGFEATLSPDGSLVAYRGGEGICVTATDGTGTPRCVPFDAPVAVSFARFSPDGAQLTFSEEFVRTLNEPDVWVLDVSDMTLANRTDDGVSDLDLTGDGAPGATIDLATTWMPDGSLVFVRADGPRGDSQLMRLDDEGDPQEVSDLTGLDPIEVVYPLVPVGDDAVLAVTSPPGDDAGLVRIDLSTGDATTITTVAEDLGLVQVADVRGSFALLRSESVVGMGSDDRTSHLLVDIESGEQYPMFAPEAFADASGQPVQPASALFTPDGTAVVYSRIRAPGALGAVSVDALVAGLTAADLGELLEPVDRDAPGDLALGWSPQAAPRWTPDGELIGVVGFGSIGTVTFADGG